jgi:F-type H+-transporting ATPase subunit b
MPEGTILSFDSSLIINIAIQWFNIILLTVILVRLLYNPVKKFMADRAQNISGHMASAHQANEEARKLKNKYEKKLAEIETEREVLLQQVHKQAMARSDQIIKEAREKTETILRQAEDQAALELRRGRDTLKTEVIELAVLMAGKFVKASMSPEVQNRLAQQALQDYMKGRQ